jgi:16S rRNA (uracil1498-N3)-methyltransferase
MKRVDIERGWFEASDEERAELPDEVAHYVRDVLRMRPGDRFELIDGSGAVAEVALAEVDAERVRVEVLSERRDRGAESPLHITLYQSIPKGDRWDLVLEKSCELGVDAVVAVETARTIVRIPDDKIARRRERWERIVASAARQSGRTVTPAVEGPRPFAETLADAPALALLAHTGEDLPSLREALARRADDPPASVGIWIGPEGGFTDEEIERARRAGLHAVHLGPRTLRAETAGVAAVAILQALAGDLGGDLV